MFMRGIGAAAFLVALAACASVDAKHQPDTPANQKAAEQIAVISAVNFEETSQNLKAAIRSRGLNLFAEIDHGAGAASAGLILPPSRLFIFGNPKAGTLFMQADGRMGLDLPLKMLVRETPAGVEVRYSDIDTLSTAYGIEGLETPRANVANALKAIATEAAGRSEG